ncbi:hypothetical protein MPSEU_000754900 [Mayamaea pseudoterrestris]|nr:hypothetical protein MPSEU_000754900 [Mayamaea pseudoterrestris]
MKLILCKILILWHVGQSTMAFHQVRVRPAVAAATRRSPRQESLQIQQSKQVLSRSSTKLYGLFSLNDEPPDDGYDLVVVGSGNGACGFLAKYLEQVDNHEQRVLVLEQGGNFFYTSDITHQLAWTKSYSEGDIFQLHNARTSNGTPIVSGRACTMGGGGSINYTMIHESSKWLARMLGHSEQYWDDLKHDLNQRFRRSDPTQRETPITNHIVKNVAAEGFTIDQDMIANIPSYQEDVDNQLIQFPTQFDMFGQRTNSGVSLVNWEDSRIELRTRVSVDELVFEPRDGQLSACVAMKIRQQSSKMEETIHVAKHGRVILCAGAASPRLLMPHRETLGNAAIGKFVNDHFAMPLGIYLSKKDLLLSPKDIYAPVFAIATWRAQERNYPHGKDTAVGFDFFSGQLQQLLYMTSHLYLAFLPNFIKSPMLNIPFLFFLTKNVVRGLVSSINVLITLLVGDVVFVSAIIKYNAASEGQYETDKDNRITLRWFDDDQDKRVAKDILKERLSLMEKLGQKPPKWLQFIYHSLTKIPFSASQVDEYVDHYSKNSLLSEQHMAGGCVFSDAADTGESSRQRTGLVHGSCNVHVADLSATHLPRVSPQMTAYLIGFHVASQLYGATAKDVP